MRNASCCFVLLLASIAAAQDSGSPTALQKKLSDLDPKPVPERLCPSCAAQHPTAKNEQAPQVERAFPQDNAVGPGFLRQAPVTAQGQTEAPEMALVADLLHPEKYAVAFLPIEPGRGSLAFLVAPNGKVGTIAMSKLGEAAKAGYRPFTVGDLLAVTNAAADEESNLYKRFKELFVGGL